MCHQGPQHPGTRTLRWLGCSHRFHGAISREHPPALGTAMQDADLSPAQQAPQVGGLHRPPEQSTALGRHPLGSAGQSPQARRTPAHGAALAPKPPAGGTDSRRGRGKAQSWGRSGGPRAVCPLRWAAGRRGGLRGKGSTVHRLSRVGPQCSATGLCQLTASIYTRWDPSTPAGTRHTAEDEQCLGVMQVQAEG